MHVSNERRNLITTANAVELAVRAQTITLNQHGNKSMNGQKITRQLLADTTAAKIRARLDDHLRG